MTDELKDSEGSSTLLEDADTFDPFGGGYDWKSARAFGMEADKTPGENFGHFGSVVRTTRAQQKQLGLPENSYMILKGKQHPTYHKAVEAEEGRGFMVKQFGNRFFSIPKE